MSLIKPVSFFSYQIVTPPAITGDFIYSAILYNDTNLYVGGKFNAIFGTSLSSIGLFNPLGNPEVVNTTFTPRVSVTNFLDIPVQGIAAMAVSAGVGSDYNLIVGGYYYNIDELPNTSHLTVLSSSDGGTGVFAKNNIFVGLPDQYVTDIIVDDKIYISGFFRNIGAVSRKGIAAYNKNGTLNTSFIHNVRSITDVVNGIKKDPSTSNRIYAYGNFRYISVSSSSTLSRRGIAKLSTTDDNLLESFNANAVLGIGAVVNDIDIDSTTVFNGRNYDVLVANSGSNTLAANRLVRLRSDTGAKVYSYANLIYTSYGSTNVNFQKVLCSGNKIYVFTYIESDINITGIAGRLYRINNTATPSIDTAFGTSGYVTVDNIIRKIIVDDTYIYIFGQFSEVRGSSRNLYSKLDLNGAVA